MLKNGISETAGEVSGMRKLVPRKPWMTNKILVLIEKRNKLCKIGNHIGYKIFNIQITGKC